MELEATIPRPSPGPRPSPSPRPGPRLLPQLLYVLWLPPLLGLLVFADTYSGGFLSDDFLLKIYVDTSDQGLAVRWSEIFADFTRPWLDLGSSFYRPMLSLSFGLDLARSGMDPAGLHATNLALHAITTVVTAWLCALCCPRRPSVAALLGGCLFAVHPIAVEPVAWLAARNSELEVFFRSFALLGFAYYVRSPSGRTFTFTGLFILCALASKESSIILPVSMLGLDLLLCPELNFGQRIRRHLAFAPFWLGYFALRFALFGQFVGSTGATISGDDIVAGFTSKTAALLIPNGPSLSLGIGIYAILGFYAIAAFNGIRDRALRPTLLLGVAWIGLHLAPTYQLRVFDDLAGSRMLYGCVTIFAIVLARLCLNGTERIARLAILSGIAAITALTLLTNQQVGHYGEVWREVDAARTQLDAIGHSLKAGQSLAITSMPKNRYGIPVLNENAFFPLAERPFASADYPVAGLGFVTLPVPNSENLYQDPAPFRVLWEEGSPLLQWQPGGENRFKVRQRPDQRNIPALVRDEARRTRFRFARPCSAYWFEGIEMTVEGRTSGGSLWWQTAFDVPAPLKHQTFGEGIYKDDRTTFKIDLSHAYGLLAFAESGVDIIDFEALFEGEARILSMRAIARLPVLDYKPQFDGASLSLDEFAQGVTVPEGATGLVLIGPHSGFRVEVAPGKPVVIPDAVRADMAVISEISSVNQYRFYFEARSRSGSDFGARSRSDGFRLRRH